MIQQIETRGEKKQNILDRKSTIIALTQITKTHKELEMRKRLTQRKKRETEMTNDLTRYSPPIEPVLIVEEQPKKNKKRQIILKNSSEERKLDQPTTSVDEEIEIYKLEENESILEVST